MRIYILRRTKNATQNFQAPQERYNKLFLHKKIWGCDCTCMHSGFLINGHPKRSHDLPTKFHQFICNYLKDMMNCTRLLSWDSP